LPYTNTIRTHANVKQGVGVSGRLGLDTTNSGNPHADAPHATLVTALAARPVVRMSAGFNHTAAVTAGGQLWTWGSGSSGKLGVGECPSDAYLAAPAKVLLGSDERRVKRVDCGAAHTAAVTAEGQLWVWGKFNHLNLLQLCIVFVVYGLYTVALRMYAHHHEWLLNKRICCTTICTPWKLLTSFQAIGLLQV
jgi:Regulator of chromosome condensation (RCC1) repeat